MIKLFISGGVPLNSSNKPLCSVKEILEPLIFANVIGHQVFSS